MIFASALQCALKALRMIICFFNDAWFAKSRRQAQIVLRQESLTSKTATFANSHSRREGGENCERGQRYFCRLLPLYGIKDWERREERKNVRSTRTVNETVLCKTYLRSIIATSPLTYAGTTPRKDGETLISDSADLIVGAIFRWRPERRYREARFCRLHVMTRMWLRLPRQAQA